MSDMIAAYIGEMSTGFFIRQVVVILMVFLFGYLLTAGESPVFFSISNNVFGSGLCET